MLGATFDSETVSKSDSRSCSVLPCTEGVWDFVGLGGCAGRRESRARSTAAGLSERVAVGVVVVLGVLCSLKENWSSDSGMSFMSRSRICEISGRREGPASDARLLLRSYCTPEECLDIRSRGVIEASTSINGNAPGLVSSRKDRTSEWSQHVTAQTLTTFSCYSTVNLYCTSVIQRYP